MGFTPIFKKYIHKGEGEGPYIKNKPQNAANFYKNISKKS